MKKLENFSLVTGVHGNETMPILALASRGISQKVANPQAVAQTKRFIEKDLNASFGSSGNSLEEKRAEQVLKALPEDQYVIDFHTFSCTSDPFSVIVDPKMIDFAQGLGIPKVVYMKHNIKKGNALINHRHGVSVEVGHHQDPQSFACTLKVVETLLSQKKLSIELYEVYGVIEKKGEYNNFELHKDGFYPVLSGERAYNHFGLKAKKIM